MKTEIYDFDSCKVNTRNGTYGGQAGTKEGITFNGENWIVKYPQTTKGMRAMEISYTTAPLSEYIGSHIYDILGYEVHETLLGIRNGKLVVACKDFCKEPGALREIRTLKNIYNKDLQYQLELSGSLSNTKGHVVNLEELLIHLQYNPILSQVQGITERFWECAVIDCLINNNDRNNGNWGVLLENDSYRLAPIYDNGASFSNKLSQNQIERILNDEGRMLQSIRGSRTAYGEGDKDYTAEELLARKDFGMKEALKKTVPLIQEKMPQIKQLIDEIPESYKGIEICSPYLKEFYKTITEKRMDYLLLPALRRVKIREDIINND